MSTKKDIKTCSVRPKNKPDKKAYAARKRQVTRTYARLSVRHGEAFAAALADLIPNTRSTTTFPDIHESPPYGEDCWYESWEEMGAWLAWAAALNAYLQIGQGGYMPPSVVQQIVQAYLDAVADYQAAWNAMEACVNGYPV